MSNPTHVSMRGVTVNMNDMRTQNEDSVAVTGRGAQLKMNARGDTLASNGRIDKRREDIDSEYNTSLSGNAKRTERANVREIEVDIFETPHQVVQRLSKPKEPAAPVVETPSHVKGAPAAATKLETETTVDAPENVAPRERSRRITEKED